MKTHSLRLFVTLGLLLLIVVSVAPVSALTVELACDDGSPESYYAYTAGYEGAVKFSLPPGWTGARILTARYYIHSDPDVFTVHIYDTGGNELITPFPATPTTTGWFNVNIDPPVEVFGDFYVVMESLSSISPWGPHLAVDTTSPYGLRSYSSWFYPWVGPHTSLDLMIRAVVEQVVVGPIPEFSLPIPVATSIAAIICLAIRKRMGKKLG